VPNRKIAPRALVAGIDCESPHEPPHFAYGSICNGPLCRQWLDQNCIDGPCQNQHAHDAHYWWATGLEVPAYVYRSCTGRPYCDPSFMEPQGENPLTKDQRRLARAQVEAKFDDDLAARMDQAQAFIEGSGFEHA
jgi:hypothetical protein